MRSRITIAAGLSCACVAAAWIVQFKYGIGSCGPASNTPVLCFAFGMGPFYLLASVHPIGQMIDALPNRVGLAIMFALPVIVWCGVFLGLLTGGAYVKRRLTDRQ